MSDAPNTACRDEAAHLIGKPGPRVYGRDGVDASSIRGFLAAVEDGNPLYWDDAFARGSRFGRLIAPPQLHFTLAHGYFWTPGPPPGGMLAQAGGPAAEVEAILRRHGYVFDINVSRDDELVELYGPGDGRISEQTTVTDVSAERATHLGAAVFVTTALEYRTERDERLVARATNVMMAYRPRDLAPGAALEGAAPPLRAAAPPAKPLEWASLAPGQPLPAATYGPITSATVAKAMADTLDFSRLMYDADFARARGLRGPVVNTMWYQGLFARYLTEWAGPEALVRRLRFRMRGSNCVGDTLTLRGAVAATRRDTTRRLVDVELHLDNQSQPDAVVGEATVDLG